jgi:hypothetical protein
LLGPNKQQGPKRALFFGGLKIEKIISSKQNCSPQAMFSLKILMQPLIASLFIVYNGMQQRFGQQVASIQTKSL